MYACLLSLSLSVSLACYDSIFFTNIATAFFRSLNQWRQATTTGKKRERKKIHGNYFILLIIPKHTENINIFFYMKSLCQLRTKPKRIRSRDTCEYEQYALSWIVTTTTTTTTTATIKWHLVNFNWINVIVVACLLSCKCMFTYWLMCSRSCAYAPLPPYHR